MLLDGTQFEALAALDIELPPPFEKQKRIQGLRMTFQVKQDLTKNTNTADISIFNLAEASRNAIQGRPDSGVPGTAITLWVGYAQGAGLQVLFRGFVTEVGHTFDPPEVRTRIQVNTDAATDLTSRASLSYAEGTLASRVLADVAKQIGLPLEFLSKFQDTPFLQGYAFGGRLRDALDEVTGKLGLQWSNQNGRLRILQPGTSTGKTTAVLSPGSGLIGSPERLWRTLDDPAAAQKPTGWKFKCLLRPEIVPGDMVGLRSREIDPARAFAVQNVTHNGDTNGDDWTTTGECLDEGATPVPGAVV